jgi:hypothetical protein
VQKVKLLFWRWQSGWDCVLKMIASAIIFYKSN